MKPVIPEDPEHARIFATLQARCRWFADAMGKWPSLIFLPIEMHKSLRKDVKDEFGQPNRLAASIKLFELEDVDRPAEADYLLDVIVWDGPVQFGIDMNSKRMSGMYWPAENPFRKKA